MISGFPCERMAVLSRAALGVPDRKAEALPWHVLHLLLGRRPGTIGALIHEFASAVAELGEDGLIELRSEFQAGPRIRALRKTLREIANGKLDRADMRGSAELALDLDDRRRSKRGSYPEDETDRGGRPGARSCTRTGIETARQAREDGRVPPPRAPALPPRSGLGYRSRGIA